MSEKQNAEMNNQKVIDAIENLLIKAYSGTLNSDLYQKNYKIILDLLNQRINKFKVLHSEAKKLSMQEEMVEIEGIIGTMQEQINQIPKNFNEAKLFVEKQLEIEKITKFCIEENENIKLLMEDFDNSLNFALEKKITSQFQYSDILQKLLIRAKEHINQISVHKSSAIKYNIDFAMHYFEKFDIEINDKVTSTPFNFEVAADVNREYNNSIKKVMEELEKIIIQIDANPNIRDNGIFSLYRKKINLTSDKSRLEYLITNIGKAKTEKEKELIILMSEIKWYEASKNALRVEIDRLEAKGYGFRSDRENNLDEWTTSERNDINELNIKNQKYAEEHSQYEGLKAQNNHLKTAQYDGTGNCIKLNEITAEILAIDAEFNNMKKYGLKNYRNERTINLYKRKSELLYEKARLDYIITHIQSAQTPKEKELTFLMSEIKGHEARRNALQVEIDRLEAKGSGSRSYSENNLLSECEFTKARADQIITFRTKEAELLKAKSSIQKITPTVNAQSSQNQNSHHSVNQNNVDSDNNLGGWNRILK